MLKVCEIFTSIQGESTHAGMLFQFIRLTGCNLRCSYCDTTYAYEEGKEMTREAICSQVKAGGIRRVLITGGEPLLQKQTPQLAADLIDEGYTVCVETNGSLDIGVLPEGVVRIMDLKCPSSSEAEKNRLENIDLLTEKDQVKFVIGSRDDFLWAKEMMGRYDLPSKCCVLFSPVFSSLEPATLADWMVQEKVKARLNLQLHKILWPQRERGV